MRPKVVRVFYSKSPDWPDCFASRQTWWAPLKLQESVLAAELVSPPVKSEVVVMAAQSVGPLQGPRTRDQAWADHLLGVAFLEEFSSTWCAKIAMYAVGTLMFMLARPDRVSMFLHHRDGGDTHSCSQLLVDVVTMCRRPFRLFQGIEPVENNSIVL